jgi:thymidylate kinase
MRIIECFGLPGSGKTTTIKNLKTNYHSINETNFDLEVLIKDQGDTDLIYSQFLKSKGNLFKIASNLLFLLSNPSFSLSLLNLIRVLGFDKHLFGLSMTLLNQLKSVENSRSMSKNINKKILVDEGLIQLMGSYAVNGNKIKKDYLTLFSRILFNYAGIIYVDVPVETSLQRLRSRANGKTRFDYMNDEVALYNLKNVKGIFEKFIHHANILNIPILALDGKVGVNSKVEEIRLWLETIK